MQISRAGVDLVKGFEGFKSYQYDDGTGTMTIGYGTTASDISPLPQHMSEPEAASFLERRLNSKYGAAVNALGMRFNQDQFDALVSFSYNLGTGILAPSHDIGRLLRTGNMRAAADSMLEYDRAGGQVLLGLLHRRQAERALFLKPIGPAPNVLNVLTADERHQVDLFDHYNQHPHLHAHALGILRQRLTVFRKGVWLAAVKGLTPGGQHTLPGWQIRNRQQRYELLLARTR